MFCLPSCGDSDSESIRVEIKLQIHQLPVWHHYIGTHLSVSFHPYKIVVMIKDLLYQLVLRIKRVNDINHVAWYIVSSYSMLTHSVLDSETLISCHIGTITTFV